MARTRWAEVADRDVRHVWRCSGGPDSPCGGRHTVRVRPSFYEENGEPLCTVCDDHMRYVRTEVRRKA